MLNGDALKLLRETDLFPTAEDRADWHSPTNSKVTEKQFQLLRAKTRSFQKIARPNEQPASQTMSRWD